MRRRDSGVYAIRPDADKIAGRVVCDEHPFAAFPACFGCVLADEWRRLYEGAGVDVARYSRDPLNLE